MKIKFLWIFLLIFVVRVDGGRGGRRRRALYSHPSDPETVKRVVKITTTFDAGNYTIVEYCTGALLNETIVLSAAHCVFRGDAEPMEDFVVEGNGQEVKGGHVWTLSSYKHSDLNEDLKESDGACFDITLLFLNEPIKIPLTSESPKFVVDCGREMYVAGECSGHGAGLTEHGKRSEEILRVPLPAVFPSKLHGLNNGACFQTNYLGRERVCPGDSGGPVICTTTKGKMSLIGVNSMLVSNYYGPEPTSEVEICKLSYGSIMTNTKALRLLVRKLPLGLKKRFLESVELDPSCGHF